MYAGLKVGNSVDFIVPNGKYISPKKYMEMHAIA